MTRGSPIPERVSTLELFFDLVFVFAITQVAGVVEHEPTAVGVARAAMVLWVLGWMYGGYAWMTNAIGPSTWRLRLLLLVGMAGFFVCSLAVPRAFGESGIAFGLGYLVVNLVHLTGLAIGSGRTPLAAIVRLAPWNLLSAGLVLAAGWTEGTLDWALWGGALALQLATPFLSHATSGFVVNAEHFAERHGLVILIVLGESLVSVGLASQHSTVDAPLVLGVLAGLAAAAAMWWAYFVGDDARGARAFQAGSNRVRARQALTGYGLAHMLMMYGVVALAAGTKLSVEDLAGPAPVFNAWLIAAGGALFLLGAAGFRIALGFGSPWPRIAGAIACLGAATIGARASVAAELASVAAAIGVTLAIEGRLERSVVTR